MIELSKSGDIHVATMNDGANTIDPAFVARMLEVLETVEADSEGSSGLVLTGDGKAFCSGLNVEVVMGLKGEAMKNFGSDMFKMMSRLLLLPVPTVAAINGHAFAAGAFLSLGCDYRIMRADRGWFCISEVDVGVPIGDPMMGLLNSKVSASAARDAVLTGHRYAADEAIAAGFADQKAEESELLDLALGRAATMASKGRKIFGALKRQLYRDAALGFGAEL